jgi:membrane associated rhomboid family serine protease
MFLPLRFLRVRTRPAYVVAFLCLVIAGVSYLWQPQVNTANGTIGARDRQVNAFVARWTMIPCEVVKDRPATAYELATGRCGARSAARSENRPEFPQKNPYLGLVLAIFFHAGFEHLVGNLFILWVFGRALEDKLGHIGALAFILGTGVFANAVFALHRAHDVVPGLGASGCVMAVLGFCLVVWPRDRVRSISILPPILVDLPAWLVIGLTAAADVFRSQSSARVGIAWDVHLSALACGIVIGGLIRLRDRSRRAALGRLPKVVPDPTVASGDLGPGWYDDPWLPSRGWRWWDGSQWTRAAKRGGRCPQVVPEGGLPDPERVPTTNGAAVAGRAAPG